MFTKLFALLSCFGVISLNAPIMVEKTIEYNEENAITHRNYQHDEFLNSYTKVTYKYETNEVESVDDYVEGNTYLLTFEVNVNTPSRSSYIVLSNNNGLYSLNELIYDNQKFLFSYSSNTEYFDILRITDLVNINQSVLAGDTLDGNGYYSLSSQESGIYVIKAIITLESIISSSWFSTSTLTYLKELPMEYNEIESVTYIQPTTIIGVINEFCETYLFSEIPLVRAMQFEVGGQTINLMTWLIIITGLIVAVVLLWLLFLLLKWLFLLFSGSLKSR